MSPRPVPALAAVELTGRPPRSAEHRRVAELVPEPPESTDDPQLAGWVVIHLGVDVVPIERVVPRGEVVVGETGKIREWKIGDELLHDRIEALAGNDVSGERGAAAAVGGAGERVVDRRRRRRKVPTSHRRCRHRPEAVGHLTIEGALVASEEERLVLDDRAAEGAAELVLAGLRFLLGRRQEVRPRLERLVVEVFEQGAAQRVGAALDQDVRGHPPRQPLISVERAGGHADRFDGLERRDVRGDVRQPEIVRDRPLDADRVRVACRAVRAERKAARGVDRHRVHVLGRRDARDRDEQVLIVAADRHRQVLELHRRDVGAHFGAVGLQDRRGRRNGHPFGNLSHLELGADAHDAVFRNSHVRCDELLEAGEVHPNRIGAWWDRRERDEAGAVRHTSPAEIGPLLRDGDVRAGDGAAALIARLDDDRAVAHLRIRERRRRREAGEHQGPQHRSTQQGLHGASLSSRLAASPESSNAHRVLSKAGGR